MPYTSYSSDTTDKANWCYTRHLPGILGRRYNDVVEQGQLWPYQNTRDLFWCPLELLTNNVFFRQRDMQVCSYTMNGSVSGFSSSPTGKPFVSYKMSLFKPHYMLYWEPDERRYDYYDNVASTPDEGCSQRHSKGIVMGLFGGSTEFIKYKVYLAELLVPKSKGGRLWVNPQTLDGH